MRMGPTRPTDENLETYMLSPFGQLVRTFRLRANMNLSDMAAALSVSPSYLSAVEFGRRAVPPTWVSEISRLLKLDQHDVTAVQHAADQSTGRSRGVIEVPLSELSPLQEEVALAFARKIKTLSDADLQEIRNHLIEERFSDNNWQRGSSKVS